MPIFKDGTQITKIYYGGSKIGKVFYGTNKVFESVKDLGAITINATGDYANNYYCNARAYIIDYKYLKITGKWFSKGDNVSGDVKAFSTNINVGPQRSNIYFDCQCYYNTIYDTGSVYTTYDGYVYSSGVLYLPLGHENCYRTFNQYDYQQVLIPLLPD